VRPRTNTARDLPRFDASGEQRVRDQRAVATPRNGFSAHQHDTFLLGEHDAPVQVLFERWGLHIIRVPAEAGVPPGHIHGVGSGTPQPAQSWHVRVVHPSAMEGWRQIVTIELRVVSRPRDRPNVNDPLDAMRLEKADEVLDRPGRVTDREDDRRPHVTSRA
jgi:hypothetical protein